MDWILCERNSYGDFDAIKTASFSNIQKWLKDVCVFLNGTLEKLSS